MTLPPLPPLPPLDLILIAARAVFLLFSFVIAAITFTRWRRATRGQTEEVLARTDIVLQRIAQLEARVDATHAALGEIGARMDNPRQVAPAGTSATGYQVAIRLARGGASPEELMSGCGLSMHEAELVQRLHAPRFIQSDAA